MKNRVLAIVAIAALLLTCIFSLTAMAGNEAETGRASAVGDVNGDESIDMKDVLLIRRFIVHLDSAIDEHAADVTGDGNVDMKDVLLLRQYIAGWNVTLASGTESGVSSVSAVSEASAVSEMSTVSELSELSELSEISERSEVSEESREPYVYGKDGEPVINFIDDANCSLGVWWWFTEDGENETTREKYLTFLEANGTTQIYYYCAYDLQDSNGRKRTNTFVKAAKDHGMTVAPILDDYNMAGDLDYAKSELKNFKQGYITYRNNYPNEPLSGFHCDIEPHQLNGKNAGLSTLQPEQLQGYADNFLDPLQDLRDEDIYIEVDLNCQWNSYGGANVTYGGYTGIYNVIAHYVDSMCLMAYRDTAEDILALGDVAFQAAMDTGTRLVFAVETGAYNFNQTNEEFAQEDKEYMYTEFAKVYATLKKNHPAGGYGLAVHHHRTWYSLKKADV